MAYGIWILRRISCFGRIRPEPFLAYPTIYPSLTNCSFPFLNPEERERTQQAVARSVETGCGFDLQYRVNGQSQSRHWVRARGSIVKDEQGGPGHLSGIVDRYRRSEAGRGSASNKGKPPSLDPGDHSRCDDRHRRQRHHAVLQQRRRKAIWLHASARRSARTSVS